MKLATNLPEPKRLSEEDLERLDRESQRLSRLVGEQTKNLERLTGDDMAVVIGGRCCS